MKLFDCLPDYIASELQNVQDLRELRIRNGGTVRVNIAGRWYFLGVKSLCVNSSKAIVVGNICDDIVKKACCNSVYAHEKTLANGFFTLEDGVRVGVCGHLFGSDRMVFQKYTSLCLRIPHYVNCVSTEVVTKCKNNNVLIIGAPGVGKTTYLRDLSVKLAKQNNVLVVDERGELFYDESLASSCGCDVLKWSGKPYAFEIGIRALAPDYIVCDELAENDAKFVKSCISSGVNLICSAHGCCTEDFNKRFGLLDCFNVVINLNDRQNMLQCIKQI